VEATPFVSDVDALLETVQEALTAFNKGSVSVQLRDNVVEYALIEATNLFEKYVEELFGQALVGSVISASPTLAVHTEQEAHLLLHQSAKPEAYLTWMPYADTTLPRANRLLANGVPFSWASQRTQDNEVLADLTVLRNFAAHRSGQAKKHFMKLCEARQYGVLSRASEFALQREQGAAQIELMLTRVKLVARALLADDETEAITILGAEDPYSSGKVSPPGKYECLKCRSSQVLLAHEKLEECLACSRAQASCQVCGRPVHVRSRWSRTLGS